MTSAAGRGAAPARPHTTAAGQRRREAHALDDCDGWRECGLPRGEARAHQPPGRPVCESGRIAGKSGRQLKGKGGRQLYECRRFKIEDASLLQSHGRLQRSLGGRGLLQAPPWLICSCGNFSPGSFFLLLCL